MKYCILYNPLSGNGGAKERAEALKNKFGESVGNAINMTEIEDYSEVLSKYGKDDVIVICGGDGTLNRFANDTADLDIEADILYSATGTGNDFLVDLGVDKDADPFSVKKYLRNLPSVTVGGKTCLFMNGIGFGIDGYCCEEGDRLKAQAPEKPVNYSAIAVKGVLGKYKPKNAKVTVDGVEYTYKRVWIAATMHGRFYGGGMMCAPAQDRLCSDGENSLVVWHGTGALRTLINFPSIFKGEHVKKTKMIAVHTGHEIKVEFDAPCALQIDGETVTGVTEYSVSSKTLAKV